MSKEALVKGYAEALFAVAEAEGSVGAVEDELFAFAKAIETQPKLRDALTDPQLPAENKKAILRDLLGGKATPHTVNILGFLIEQGRARDLEKIIEKLAEVAAEAGERAAEIEQLRRLPRDLVDRLAAQLALAAVPQRADAGHNLPADEWHTDLQPWPDQPAGVFSLPTRLSQDSNISSKNLTDSANSRS